MHALNNAVGFRWQSTDDMEFACQDYLRVASWEGSTEDRANHASPSGWYSSEVMARAVNTTSMRHAGRIEYTMLLEPLHANPDALHTSVGAVVNIGNRHWVALRSIAGQIWRLDSQDPMPRLMTESSYRSYIDQNRGAFALVSATTHS